MNDTVPVLITGKVELSDGSSNMFQIHPEHGWQQWGNTEDKLWTTTELLTSLEQAASEHLIDPETQ